MKTVVRYSLVVVLSLLSTGCYQPDKYDNPSPDLVQLEHTGTPLTGLADGTTPTEIRARISSDAARSKRTVVFRTTLGSFVGGKGDSLRTEAAADFVATAKLISPSEGSATVSAKTYGVEANPKVQVTFARVYPTRITVSVDSFAVSNSITNELLLTATLSSTDGRPSAGTLVTFDATYPSNPAGPQATAGSFVNNIRQARTDANGVARIRYSPGGIDYQGYLTITATTSSALNTPPDLAASTRVFLYRK
ncbi:hypothetical protein LGH70_20865 [Hymenobacter sp. BT635]|uniref:Big-1 domain-containing protein n=1 Tax=Hymenobacter nitidus TaxID=2880929 RepID=A0ABS8AKN2_9BACT|nr:hypothetical protein [Hymenobacter nitidus]MCB2380059.1 hypothetical protein [Hymenobacter nitidus]